MLPGTEPSLVAEHTDGQLQAWLTAGPDVLASARADRRPDMDVPAGEAGGDTLRKG